MFFLGQGIMLLTQMVNLPITTAVCQQFEPTERTVSIPVYPINHTQTRIENALTSPRSNDH